MPEMSRSMCVCVTKMKKKSNIQYINSRRPIFNFKLIIYLLPIYIRVLYIIKKNTSLKTQMYNITKKENFFVVFVCCNKD